MIVCVGHKKKKFYRRQQQAGESLDQYVTALRQQADRCHFPHITPEEILRDRILFGMADGKVQESLFRKDGITLGKVIGTCRTAELSHARMREVDGNPKPTESVSVVMQNKKGYTKYQYRGQWEPAHSGECRFCGEFFHEFRKELCPAYGKRCSKCGRENQYAKMCQKKVSSQRNVNTADQSSEEDVYILREAPLKQCTSDRFVTLKLQESGNFMKFQLATGAECNVVPLEMYKEATGDILLSTVMPSTDAIVAFGGSKMLLAGRVLLPVSHGDTRCTLRCNLADAKRFVHC